MISQTYMSDEDRAKLIEELRAKTGNDYSRWSNGQLLNEASYLGLRSL